MYLSDKWEDYRIVDASGGEKLEYWGKYLLRRPDPIAVWDDKVDINDYKQLLGISASGEEITDTDLSIILDLDFNGDVNFRDLSVLLQFIGNKIGDYYEAYKTK